MLFVDAEIKTYSTQIRSLLERVCACLEPSDEAQLNEQPPLPGANSPYVIAAHVAGNARAWVLGIACGRPLRRDRPAEFASSGSHAEISAEIGRLMHEIGGALAALDPKELDRRLLPAQELWGEGKASEISVREALLHVIEHASIHLGQLQVTRDLLLAERGR